jgi:plasmid stabilization system protein ParE
MPALKRHRLVRADLREAFNWYDERKPGLGLEFMAEVRLVCRRLKRNPLRNPARFAQVRRANMSRFPYGIFYVIRPEYVVIVAVLHTSRDTAAILAQRHVLPD